jgi:hypothetical protein
LVVRAADFAGGRELAAFAAAGRLGPAGRAGSPFFAGALFLVVVRRPPDLAGAAFFAPAAFFTDRFAADFAGLAFLALALAGLALTGADFFAGALTGADFFAAPRATGAFFAAFAGAFAGALRAPVDAFFAGDAFAPDARFAAARAEEVFEALLVVLATDGPFAADSGGVEGAPDGPPAAPAAGGPDGWLVAAGAGAGDGADGVVTSSACPRRRSSRRSRPPRSSAIVCPPRRAGRSVRPGPRVDAG